MSKWKNLRVLITGADGFIGSHLAKRLVELNADVSVTLRGTTPSNIEPNILSSIKVYDLDVLDLNKLQSTVAKTCPQKIFHLAALTPRTGDDSIIDKMFRVNVLGMLNILNALKKNSYDCFMQFSTSGEYGNSDIALTENSPLKPNSPYACAKACASLYCQMLSKTYPIIIARLFSVYGAKNNSLTFVEGLVQSAQDRSPFNMTHGRQTRDFIFIDDIVDAIIKLAITKEAIGQSFNICSGTETSIREFALAFNQSLKNPIDIQFSSIPTSANEISNNLGDNSKLKKVTGWEPSTTLKQGIQQLIEYHRL